MATALGALGLLAAPHARAASGCVPYGQPGAAGSGQLCTLAAHPGALCNDGSPGIYYIRRANPDTGTWLFYLQGGGACTSDATCATRLKRSPQFTTSAGWRPKLQGILSPDPATNPLLAGANVVEVHYCSSDYWSGTKNASAAFNTRPAGESWNFRGRTIAYAALHDVAVRDASTRFSQARRILFAGSSAGGVGITITLHDLLPLVPPGTRSLLANDAGYSLRIGGFDAAAPGAVSGRQPLDAMITAGIALWHGHGDTPCWQAASTPGQRIDCYDTARLLSDGSITQDSFSAQMQLDTAQLRINGFYTGNTHDAAHQAYAGRFACAMQLGLQASRPANSVYAPQRFAHEMFTSDAAFTDLNQFPGAAGGTLSASAALAGWLAHPGRRAVDIGDGMGIGCPR